jgi:isoleucyl-tRNA synthetase
MRKDADLMVDDRIEVAFHASERLAEAIAEHEEFVMAEILATDMQESEKPTGKHEATHTFDEETLTVAITPQGKTS